MVYEARYARLAEEEIESVRARFAQRRRSQSGPPQTRTNQYEEAKRNYSLAARPQEEEDMDFSPTGGEEADMAGNENPRGEPYLIDEAEFSEGYLHHDKETLYWCRADGALRDDAEDPVDGAEQIIGADALVALSVRDMCWVRNEALETDYEILAAEGPCAETARGAAMSPRELYDSRRGSGEEE